MKTSYFAVYDRLSESYSRLIGSPSLRALVRTMQDETPANHAWRKHPEDFMLYHVLDVMSDCRIDELSTPEFPKIEMSSLSSIFGEVSRDEQ